MVESVAAAKREAAAAPSTEAAAAANETEVTVITEAAAAPTESAAVDMAMVVEASSIVADGTPAASETAEEVSTEVTTSEPIMVLQAANPSEAAPTEGTAVTAPEGGAAAESSAPPMGGEPLVS